MLISTRSRYGLRALVRMARHGADTPISLAELAASEEVSTRYLEQIFAKLRARGIVKGRRGPGGGYTLSRPPSEIRLFDVICTLENCIFTPECLGDLPGMSKRRNRSRECEKADACITRKLWLAMRDSCAGLLMRNTLEDLVRNDIRKG